MCLPYLKILNTNYSNSFVKISYVNNFLTNYEMFTYKLYRYYSRDDTGEFKLIRAE